MFGTDEERRHKREKVAMQRVNHPNLVKFHESHYDASKRVYFMVMEFADGRSLAEVLRTEGAFSQRKLLEVAISVCEVLHAMHQENIIHLDIKVWRGIEYRPCMCTHIGAGYISVYPLYHLPCSEFQIGDQCNLRTYCCHLLLLEPHFCQLQNIMYQDGKAGGASWSIKLIDFGLAQANSLEQGELTAPAPGVGVGVASADSVLARSIRCLT
jgi:serine/threonine protein kinase